VCCSELLVIMGFPDADHLRAITVSLTCALSLIACLRLLLVSLPRVRCEHQQKPLVRHVRHLAVADSCNAICGVVQCGLMPFCTSNFGVGTCALANAVSGAVGAVGIPVSLLIETSIALSFAAELHRWAKLVHLLHHTLWWIWPLSLAFAFADFALTSASVSSGGWGSVQTNRDYVFLFALLATVAANSLVYISTVVSMLWKSLLPSSVARWITIRAANYCLVALICFVPEVTSQYLPHPPLTVAHTLFAANGFFNFLAYANCSRYLRASATGEELNQAETTQGRAAIASFHVGFRETVSVVVVFDRSSVETSPPLQPN